MAITGTVFNDKNANSTQDAGEMGISGLKVTLDDWPSYNTLHEETTTDGNGFYSLDDSLLVASNYALQVWISGDWIPTTSTNPYIAGSISPGQVINFGFASRCTRTPQSTWVYKVCFYTGQGVVVTFHDRIRHKGQKLFTCLYPNTVLSDYTQIIDAASKGRWIHWFYDKKRTYIPWPISP